MPSLSIQFTLEPDEEADRETVLTYARTLAQRTGLPPPGDDAVITTHKPVDIGPHRYDVTYREKQPCPPT